MMNDQEYLKMFDNAPNGQAYLHQKSLTNNDPISTAPIEDRAIHKFTSPLKPVAMA